MATLPPFQHPENVKISIFPFTLSQRNAMSSKVFGEFSKALFRLKDDEGGYCCWKLQVHKSFGFAIATLPLLQHPENVKISISLYTFRAEMLHFQDYLNNIQKTFLGRKIRKVAIVVEKFKGTDILVLQ